MTETMASMTIGEVLSIILTICGLFLGIFTYLIKSRNDALIRSYEQIRKDSSDHFDTIWKRIDENKISIERTNRNLDRNYHDKKDMEKYVQLINLPIMNKIDSVEKQISELKVMICNLLKENPK